MSFANSVLTVMNDLHRKFFDFVDKQISIWKIHRGTCKHKDSAKRCAADINNININNITYI